MKRRSFLSRLSTTAAAFTVADALHAQTIETHKGDPDMEPETLSFDPVKVDPLIGATRASYAAKLPGYEAALVDTAAEFVGKNRQNARQEIADMLGLFGLPFERGGKPYAFCAAGLSWIAALAYARKYKAKGMPTFNDVVQYLGEVNKYHFFPSPSVIDMVRTAQGARRWVLPQDAKPRKGWLVVFQFAPGSYHVGLVEGTKGSDLQTIEFNTAASTGGSNRDGGAIARKNRSMTTYVQGYIDSGRVLTL